MAKNIKSIAEVLKEIQAPLGKNGKSTIGRFSKEKFEKILLATANDVDFTFEAVNTKKGETPTPNPKQVTAMFREFLYNVLVDAGVDKNDAQAVKSADFTINNVSGLYEFFTATVQTYMESGNRYDFITTNDFRGSVFVKAKEKTEVTKTSRNPKTGEVSGPFKTTTEAHKVLGVKSTCLDHLKSRLKVVEK